MGHMLASSNPEAAAAMNGDFQVVPVGLPVKFISRQGSMRAGRTEFFATVMKQHENDGSVDLLVLMEPEDLTEERHIQRKSEHQIFHVWEPIVPTFDEVTEMFAAVNKRLNEIEAATLGPFKDPPLSVMEYLEQIDQRISALEAKK